MADTKISALPAATLPLAGTEVLPIVQGGTTDKVSVANLTAGRTQTSNGIVQGTAGTGYNFTANTPAAGMTSQLLNWYEEGTFTPAIEGETTNPTVGYSTQYGAYTRIGRMVNFSIRLTLSSLSGGSGNVKIVGLPFTAGLSNNPYACAMEVSGVTFGAGLTAISYRPLSGQTWGRLNQFGSGAAAAATTIAQLSSTADIIISGAYMV